MQLPLIGLVNFGSQGICRVLIRFKDPSLKPNHPLSLYHSGRLLCKWGHLLWYIYEYLCENIICADFLFVYFQLQWTNVMRASFTNSNVCLAWQKSVLLFFFFSRFLFWQCYMPHNLNYGFHILKHSKGAQQTLLILCFILYATATYVMRVCVRACLKQTVPSIYEYI